MDKNNTSVKYNLDQNYDSEGYKNEDIGNNGSIVKVLIQTLQILKFHQWGLVKFLVIILIFGINLMIMDLTPLMMLLLLPMETFLPGQLTSLL